MSAHGNPDVVTSGLVLHLDAADIKSYPRTGTVWVDRSGNGNNGTLVNGVGYSNGDMVFDGANDYVECPLIGNMSTTDFTVTIIAKHNLSTPARTTFWGFSQGGDYAYETFCFQTWNGNINEIMFFSGNGSALNNQIFTPENLDTKKYNEYSFIIKYSGDISLSINGNLYNTWTTNTLRNTNNFDRVWLGQRGNQYLVGNIASFKIYNRALSQEEILQNYNATKSRFQL